MSSSTFHDRKLMGHIHDQKSVFHTCTLLLLALNNLFCPSKIFLKPWMGMMEMLHSWLNIQQSLHFDQLWVSTTTTDDCPKPFL